MIFLDEKAGAKAAGIAVESADVKNMKSYDIKQFRKRAEETNSEAPSSPAIMPTFNKFSTKIALGDAMQMSHIQVKLLPAP